MSSSKVSSPASTTVVEAYTQGRSCEGDRTTPAGAGPTLADKTVLQEANNGLENDKKRLGDNRARLVGEMNLLINRRNELQAELATTHITPPSMGQAEGQNARDVRRDERSLGRLVYADGSLL